jgi:hypothetical protein
MKNLRGADPVHYTSLKANAINFLKETRLYTDNQSNYASCIAEYLLWEQSLSIRLPVGETQRYNDGKRLAENHIEHGVVSKESPSSGDDEFNNGYWDKIAEERKILQQKLAALTH